MATELPPLDELVGTLPPKKKTKPKTDYGDLSALPSLELDSPKRGRKPNKSKGKPKAKVTKKEVRQGITIAVSLGDSFVLGNVLGFKHTTDPELATPDHMPIPGGIYWHMDRLTPDEQQLLAEAVTEEVLLHEKLIAWASKLREITPHGKLIMALMLIATPRLARRGIVPMELAMAFAGGGMPATQGESQDATSNPVSMESGTAPIYSGRNGDGQVNPSELSFNPA